MKPLDPEARALIDAVRDDAEPSADDRARVSRRLAARLPAFAVGTVAPFVRPESAAALGASTKVATTGVAALSVFGKVMGVSAVVLASAAVVVVVQTPRHESAAIERPQTVAPPAAVPVPAQAAARGGAPTVPIAQVPERAPSPPRLSTATPVVRVPVVAEPPRAQPRIARAANAVQLAPATRTRARSSATASAIEPRPAVGVAHEPLAPTPLPPADSTAATAKVAASDSATVADVSHPETQPPAKYKLEVGEVPYAAAREQPSPPEPRTRAALPRLEPEESRCSDPRAKRCSAVTRRGRWP